MFQIYNFFVTDGDAFTLWNQLKDIKVGVYKIARTFSSTSKLSHLKLNYQKIKQTRMDHLFSDFEHKVLTTHSEDILQENAVNMIVTLLKKRIKIEFDASVLKNHVMHEMVNKLFKPLVASITLETKRHRFWAEEECDDKVQVSNLGIGIEEETWYGSIDGCLRAHSGEVPFLNDSEEEPETDGTSTCLELKRASKRLSQVIGSAVLTSFIGNRLHPQLNALVPCILLNCISTQYIFYDCVKDVLLISEKVDLYDDHGRVSQQAMLIMWLVINHR